MKKVFCLGLIFVLLFQISYAQNKKASSNPGLKLIKTAELQKDLYDLADAHFNGGCAGTLDELKSSMWIGEKYRQLGLTPMGDDGTYFQYFTMYKNSIDSKTSVSINGNKLNLWKDIAIAQMANENLEGEVIYLGDVRNIDTNKLDVKGKIVALQASSKEINTVVSLPTWRYSRSIYMKYGMPLVRHGAKAIVFINDDYGDAAWDDANENFKRGTFDIEGGPNMTLQPMVPVFWVKQASKSLFEVGANLKATILIQHSEYPSVNIIGKIEGTDPVLKKEYLLYSGHQDAHGIRNTVDKDSIFYGADDNASVDVAMFAIARAFKKFPSKRSVIFVIQGAEERGLLGSRYYSSHLTIPQGSIVAVLNGDMIGRNNKDSAAILGMQLPHRNSLALVNMALDANKEGPQFKLDTAYDKVTHVEGWYFRSDHLPYARMGIPSLMYTTLLHADYHTPKDNAENIDYPKLKKMTDWMYLTGFKVANATEKPAKDKDFKLER